MIVAHPDHGRSLAAILDAIERAEDDARHHDRSPSERELHAEAAQQADARAEAARQRARRLIEDAFPGVSWSRIERAAL